MNDNFLMLAKTLFGFEPLLERELRELGAANVKVVNRGVTFEGDLGFMYKANLFLRTAIKILMPIKRFRARDEEELYHRIKQIRWEKYMEADGSLAVGATVFSRTFTHSKFIALKTKDGIVDRFRERSGTRPNVDLRRPSLAINIHIQEQDVTVSLDTSGESLHQRGYRTAVNLAPINEVLAAGLVMMTGWDGENDVLDPMCGSGTMLIEACMWANRIPANINRREFGFERWKDYDPDLFELIRNSALKKMRDRPIKFIGYDKAPSAVRKATDNVYNAGLDDFITIEQQDFFKAEGRENVTIMTNPPYGERLEINIPEFYARIGDTFKKVYKGCAAWLITGDLSALKHVGLKTSRKIKVYNGKLESRWAKYEMYSGSKKASKQVEPSGEDE